MPAAPGRVFFEGALRKALLCALVLAPLPFGCVEDWSRWLLISGLGLTVGLFWMAGGSLRSGGRRRVGLLLAAGFVLWTALQIVPLPPSLLARLSPEAHRLYGQAVPGYDRADASGYAVPARHPPGDSGPGGAAWSVPTFSSWRSLSLDPYSTYRVACQSAALLGFVALGLTLFRGEALARALAWTMVAAAAGQAVYGSVEAVTGHQHIFLYEKRYYTDSATGTLVNRNHFAGMLNMALPIGMALLLQTRERRTREPLPGGSGPRRIRIGVAIEEPLALACVLAIGVGTVLSRSRMGIATMLATALALSVAARAGWLESAPAGIAAPRGDSRRRGAVVAALPLALLVLIGVYALGMDAGGAFDRFRLVPDDLHAGAIRPALWRETIPVAGRFLWTGAGAGAYPYALNPQLRELALPDFWLYNHAHNDYLEAIVTLGVIGLLPAISVLLLWLKPPARGLRLAALFGLASLMLHSLTDFLLATPSKALLAAALMVLAAPPAPDGTASRRGAARRVPLLAAAACLLAVLAGPGRALAAAMIYRPYWTTPLETTEARQALRIATLLEPRDPAYRRYLGQGEYAAAQRLALGEVQAGADLEEQVGRWQRARLEGLSRAHRHLTDSLSLGPVDYTLHGEIARVVTEERALARRLGLPSPPGGPSSPASVAPHRASAALGPTAYGNLGDLAILLWKGRDDLGEEAAREALRIQALTAGRPEVGQARLEELLRAADDETELGMIDRGLAPPSGAYAALLSDPEWRPLPAARRCARALWAIAGLRETRREIDGAAGAGTALAAARREALRERVRELLRWREPDAPPSPGERAPACGEEELPARITQDALGLLSLLADTPPPSPASESR